jgi:hypothetical protein
MCKVLVLIPAPEKKKKTKTNKQTGRNTVILDLEECWSAYGRSLLQKLHRPLKAELFRLEP